MDLGLITFLVVALLLVAWLLVSILSPQSNATQNALKTAVCDILGC